MPSHATRFRWALAGTLFLSIGCGPESVESEAAVAASEQPIIGGTLTTSIADNPWQVSVRFNGFTHCGGVILNENWILTTAYCVTGPVEDWTITVVAGSLRRLGSEGQHRLISQIVNHPSYVH